MVAKRGPLRRKFEAHTWWVHNRQGTTPRLCFTYKREEWNTSMQEAAAQISDLVNGRKSKISYPLQEKYPIPAKWEPTYALANWYKTKKDSVGLHSDHLTRLGPCPVIASLSVGATRTFQMVQRRSGTAIGSASLGNA